MTQILIHPGEHLAGGLMTLGISGDTALRLGRGFGAGPDIWINLQKNYELKLTAREIGDAIKAIPRGKARRAGEPQHSRL